MYSVNANAMTIPVQTYGLHEVVELDGAFVSANKEQTQGYSLVVNEANLMSFSEYLEKYSQNEEVSGTSNAKSIIEVGITIRNDGNENGYLDVNGWRLVPERGNDYLVVNSELWQIGEPNAPGAIDALSLIPDSEYVVYTPFVRNTNEETMFVDEIADLRFSLVMSDTLIQKKFILRSRAVVF